MKLKGNVFSQTLQMDTGISVVTPNELKTDGAYKIVYLLHGLCGDSSTWMDYSMLPAYANEYDAIFVMPEAGRSFYIDMKYGLRYFTYIADELPEICKNIFNISSKREDTAILGSSMGGYGALRCTLLRPGQYGFCGAFASPYLILKEFMDYYRETGRLDVPDFPAIFGENLEWKPEYEILHLAERLHKEKIKPQIYTACGTEDYLYDVNIRFRDAMQAYDFDYTYEEWPANHDWNFFNQALDKALKKFFRKN